MSTVLSTTKSFLHQIYADAQPQLDIVLVHGLDPFNKPKHAYSTWSSGDVLWLRDLLPENKKRPSIRALLYGYNSSAVFGASTGGIDAASRTLLDYLQIHRRDDPKRPLVVICHSLGGIVAKNAMIDARLDPTYSDIYNAIRAFVFFATPHQGGGNKALLGDAVVKAMRSLGFPRNDIMEALRHDSVVTGPINQRFRHLIAGRHIISFIETWPMAHMGLVVERHSAALNIDGELQVDMEASHSTICKFSSRDDDQYQRVETHLVDLFEWAVMHRPEFHPSRSSTNTMDSLTTGPPLYDSRRHSVSTTGSSEAGHFEPVSLDPLSLSSGRSDEDSDHGESLMSDGEDESTSSSFLNTFTWLKTSRKPKQKSATPQSTGQSRWPTVMHSALHVNHTHDRIVVDRPFLFNQMTSAGGMPMALCGLDGCGKTQLVLDYARGRIAKNPKVAVLWTDASTVDEFWASLDDMPFLEASDKKLRSWQGLALKQWLEEPAHGEWLWILDDASDDAIKSFRDVLPVSNKGQLVFTTSNKGALDHLPFPVTAIEVGAFDAIEAAACLETLLRRELLQNAHSESVRMISERLDFIPLAITQAAAFMNTNNVTLDSYLRRTIEAESIFNNLTSVEDSVGSLDRLWKVSFDQMQASEPIAVSILSFASFLDNKSVPFFLLEKAFDVGKVVSGLKTLEAHSFVDMNYEERSFAFNNMIKAGVQRWLTPAGQQWQKLAFSIVSALFFEDEESDSIEFRRKLLPHGLALIRNESHANSGIPKSSKSTSSAVLTNSDGMARHSDEAFFTEHTTILNIEIGIYWLQIGDYFSGLKHLQKAKADANLNQYGDGRWYLRGTIALLNALHYTMEPYIDLAREFKDVCKFRYGMKSVETCKAYNLLSNGYRNEWRLNEALKASRKAWICAQDIPRDNVQRVPLNMLTLRRKAAVHEMLHQYSAAESDMIEATLVWNESLQIDRIGYAMVLSRLTIIQVKIGRYEDAEVTIKEAHQIECQNLGENHPSTLKNLYNYALVDQGRERWDEAQAKLETCLEQSIRQFGPTFYYTVRVQLALAEVLELGKKDTADLVRGKELYEQALASLSIGTNKRQTGDANMAQVGLCSISWKLNKQYRTRSEAQLQQLIKKGGKPTADRAMQAWWRALEALATLKIDIAYDQIPVSATVLKQAIASQSQLVKSMEKLLGKRQPRTLDAAATLARYQAML